MSANRREDPLHLRDLQSLIRVELGVMRHSRTMGRANLFEPNSLLGLFATQFMPMVWACDAEL